MVSFKLQGRRQVLSNSVFEVYFDAVGEDNAPVSVEDFLIVRPRVRSGIVGGVIVLPEADGKIGLMSGYRHQFDREIWQAPAGFLEPGEAVEHTALRELREETNLACLPENLESLGEFLPDAGLIDATVSLFLAKDCTMIADGVRESEPGTGALTFFDAPSLKALILEERFIGGATIAACSRWLLTRTAL